MKLINILKKNFVLPLILCFVICVAFALFISIYYSADYSEDNFQYHIRKGKDQSISLVLTLAQELIYNRFQTIFDYLITSREVLEKYHSIEPTTDKEYYKSYLVSLSDLVVREENMETEENRLIWFISKEANSIDSLLGEANKNSKRYIQLKYLFVFSKILPFFKGFYNNFKGKKEFSIKSFYIMNRKTELFVLYPVNKHSYYREIYDYNKEQNTKNCRNKDRLIPSDYYIFCSEPFINIEEIYRKNPNRRMFLSYPYQSMVEENESDSDRYIVSACYIFNFTNNSDIVENDIYKKTLNDEIIVCADIFVSSYFQIFDNFQKELYGYFYLSITQKKYPMYYPGMTEDPFFSDITRFEYNYSYFTFSILNVTNFNTITLPKLIKEYNPDTDINIPQANKYDIRDEKHYYTVKMNNSENTFQKGENIFNYFIYPIFFDNYNLNSDNNNNMKKENKNKEHILSLIYIMNENDINGPLDALSPYVKFLSILYCLIFILIGFIIMMCASYGVFIISSNIIKPINDIKSRLQAGLMKKSNILKGDKNKNEFTYQGININKLISLGLIGKKNMLLNKKSIQDNNENMNIEFDRNSNDIFGRYILGNENLLNGNDEEEKLGDGFEGADKLYNENNEDFLNNEFGNEEDEDSDDDDEIFLVKNSEINNQFNLLLDLKKINIFMKGPLVNSKDSNIFKFISCDKVFNEIKSKLGDNICLSNIGNLENINKRYDKSVLFLAKSLGLEDDKLNENKSIKNFNDIHQEIENIFEKEDNIRVKGIDNFNKALKENHSLNFRKTIVKENSYKENEINKDDIYSNINNIEFIRFMKLFFAFKMYFSNVKKIEKILNKTLHMTSVKNHIDENMKKSYTYIYVKSILFYFKDYFISNSIHIHKKYKTAIYVCLQRLIESKDITRKKEKIIYCYSELFSYYISYLKLKIKRAINELMENNDENETSSSSFGKKEYDKLKSNKISSNEKTFKKVVNIAKNVKEYINKMNSKFRGNHGVISEGEKNKYKDFLNELKNVNQKNYNIQFNIFLIEQRYYYLFAKFSKLCGDYAMAINYYLKVVNEERLISNGILNIKANNKIRNIINFANNNPQFLSIQEKDERILREILFKCNKQLDFKKTNNKDIIVILDRNYDIFDDEKKYRIQMQQYKTLTMIFENFLSLKDRFAYYTFGNENDDENINRENEDVYMDYIKNNSIKKLISLTYKNNKNYSFIKGIIDKFHDDIINYLGNQKIYLGLNKDDQNKSSFNENSLLKIKTNNQTNDAHKMKIKCTINTIFKVFNDIIAFNNDDDRKKYVILITESFQNEQNNNELTRGNIKNLFKDLNDCYKANVEKLFIIGTSLEEQNKYKLIGPELLNYGIRNEYLEFENIQELNKKLLTLGSFPRKYEYPNEQLNKGDNK